MPHTEAVMHRPQRILRRAENVVRGTVDSIRDARYIAQTTGGIRHMPEDAMHRTGSIEREARGGLHLTYTTCPSARY